MRTWQVLPSAMYRDAELLTTRGGGHDAATAGRTGAEPSRARRGCDAGVAITAVASNVSAKTIRRRCVLLRNAPRAQRILCVHGRAQLLAGRPVPAALRPRSQTTNYQLSCLCMHARVKHMDPRPRGAGNVLTPASPPSRHTPNEAGKLTGSRASSRRASDARTPRSFSTICIANEQLTHATRLS